MRVAVAGGGMAGLGAALEIKKAGGEPVVFEASDRVGGRVRTVKRNGFTFDPGAILYLGSYKESAELMRELGLSAEMSKLSASGSLVRNGKLCDLDFTKPLSVLRTDYLTGSEKRKVLKLIFQVARNWKSLGFGSVDGTGPIDLETAESWCRREVGQELLDYVASPVIRGPWLTDASYTSQALLLWTLKNFRVPYFYGLDGGMDALPRAMAERLDVRLNTPVQDVTDTGTGVEVTTEHGTETYDAAVVATTADKALDIYPQISGVARDFFESVEYVSSVSTHVALSRRPDNQARYVWVSPREHENLCSVYVDHFKARNRAPEGKGLLSIFCRHEWGLERMDAPGEEILEEVLGFIEPYYGDLSSTVEDVEFARWPQVIPMMKPGRFRALDAYQKSIDPTARVQLAGDMEIPCVNGALVSGQAAGRRVAAGGAGRSRAAAPAATSAAV